MDINGITVTASEMGEILGISDRRVRQLVDEGIFERAERGRYPLAANVQAYLATCEGASDSESGFAQRSNVKSRMPLQRPEGAAF